MNIRNILFILITLLLTGNITSAQQLPRSTPEKEGVSSQGIIDFVKAADKSNSEFHSFMIVRHGKVIAEGWWNPYSSKLVHTLYSVSKSFTSTAVGFAVSEGKLNVNDKVVSFFPDKLPAVVSPYLAEMKIKDLLTMSSGHDPEPTDTVRNSGDWIKTFLAQPLTHEPGKKFVYNSVATYMLSAIVQKVTGQKVVDYLTSRFFNPLGISGADWETSPQGINTGGWGLRLHTEDLAKEGQFYLQKGKWNGKQLLPESWINEATSIQINQWPQWIGTDTTGKATNDWMQGYGYQFWRCTHNFYRADGAYGQYVLVMPELDAVVAITGESNDLQGELNLVWQYLLPAISDKELPGNELKNKELKKLSASLALPVAPKTKSPTALLKSGKKYEMDKNNSGIKLISIKSHGNTIDLTLDGYTFPFGAGKWEFSETERMGPGILKGNSKFTGKLKTAGSYKWIDDSTVEFKLRYIESPHSETFTLKFDNEKLYVETQASLSFGNEITKLEGKAK
jgi:CubicO group peptidase (beta-lactamase class C family)